MRDNFIVSLPRGANGKDFRVIADYGGYAERINELEATLLHIFSATFTLTAQRDFTMLSMRVTVNRTTYSRDGVQVRFDGAVGELLDRGGRPTGNFYDLVLGIDPSITYAGQTVGVLRMRDMRLPAVS